MINCIIIEDQIPAQKILKKFIKDAGTLELKAVFNNALSAMDYLSNNKIDLMFLDIHLPKLSGIEFLNILPHKPLVILSTAFSDYALKGYDLDVVDYLLKPFSFDRFLKAVLKVEQRMQITKNVSSKEQKDDDSIVVKDGYDFVKIAKDEILYIKSDGDYTHICCSKKKYVVSYPLKHWLEQLPENQFFQVHRSYIVNVKKIKKVSPASIEINKTNIPIGRVYKKQFHEFYMK